MAELYRVEAILVQGEHDSGVLQDGRWLVRDVQAERDVALVRKLLEIVDSCPELYKRKTIAFYLKKLANELSADYSIDKLGYGEELITAIADALAAEQPHECAKAQREESDE